MTTDPRLGAAGVNWLTAKGEQDRTVSDRELELVRAAAAGDQEAFAALYRASVSAVTRYVGAILRDQARTEDAVAQTFMEAWQQLPRLREGARFQAWLLRIAHNRAIDDVRRRPTEPLEAAHAVAASPGQDPERAAMARGDLMDVRMALLALPEEQRAAVVLRHLYGLRHAEIAQQLGRSEEASRALLHRGVRALRAAMRDGPPDP